MPQIADAVSEAHNGVIVSVEVTPGARQDLFPAGFNPWRKTIGCRVAAPALGGRANAAVLAVIAASLHLPHTAVRIQAGATSSIKKIHITGMTKADFVARIPALPGK